MKKNLLLLAIMTLGLNTVAFSAGQKKLATSKLDAQGKIEDLIEKIKGKEKELEDMNKQLSEKKSRT